MKNLLLLAALVSASAFAGTIPLQPSPVDLTYQIADGDGDFFGIVYGCHPGFCESSQVVDLVYDGPLGISGQPEAISSRDVAKSPEPSTLLLIATGLAGIALIKRKRKAF